MSKISNLEPSRVFKFFEDITKIPHGSGNTDKISEYCENFAKSNNLKYIRDKYNNVIIYKNGTVGYEKSEAVILQGHLDMVCQKEDSMAINFITESIDAYVDEDFVKARGTTLGADNGIAVAMILAILESDSYSHPSIEAVFTTDEETGMGGALNIATELLKANKMINLDSEEEDTMTVSCCGGSCMLVSLPFEREKAIGTKITVFINGLQGGHSGMEIHKGRVNANVLAGRILNHLRNNSDFKLISVVGGDKTNAITNACKFEILSSNFQELLKEFENFSAVLKKEFSSREPNFNLEINVKENQTVEVIPEKVAHSFITALAIAPQGVVEMSADMPDLVETSTNVGVVNTDDGALTVRHSFRSNKESAINYLKEKVSAIYSNINCTIEFYGEYPSWEFKYDSKLQELYKQCYKEYFGRDVKVSAVHAGLECGVFSNKIKNLDCISIGPDMFDVHTVNEKLSISSVKNMFSLLLTVLSRL